MESISYLYTSPAEIERLLGFVGVSAYADDTGEGEEESGVVQDAIEEATDTINVYLEQWYHPSDMANNKWIRRKATYLAAYILTRRRGNPGMYEEEYQRITSLLEDIRLGRKQVPRLPWRSDFTPAVDNVVVDHRFMVDKVRVQQQISSTGTPARPIDPTQVYDII